MTRILLAVATPLELKPLLSRLEHKPNTAQNIESYTYNNTYIDILYTGIGLVAMSFWLTKTLMENKYDLVINAGIGGAFNSDLKMGEVVVVVNDVIAEMGIKTEKGFKPMSSITLEGMVAEMDMANDNTFYAASLKALKQVKGISVNTVSGTGDVISVYNKLYAADIESMEGAAFLYVCNKLHIKGVQLRAVSNYVEPRQKSKWDIEKAVENLSQTLLKFFEELK